MKFARIGPRRHERPALVDRTGRYRDISALIDDITGEDPRESGAFDSLDIESLPLFAEDARVGPCVADIGKIICVGLNYSDHAAETNSPLPAEPILFGKATSAINGPYDDVVIPRRSTHTDWEVELGIVIGREARYVSESTAMEYVSGFCVVNDVSERHAQKERCGQWIKGKSADTFAPIGPWLVTKDEIADVANLHMWLEVDGHRYQDGSTSTMIFGVGMLVSYISQFMSLQPGDIIPTGTPPGVGMGKNPPIYLKPGQVMTLGIEGLGQQRQQVIAFDGP